MAEGINIWAAVLAALSTFLLGGVWYAPNVFGTTWNTESGNTFDRCHGRSVYVISFLFSLIAALGFAFFLGPKPSLSFAAGAGFAVGLCWVASSFGMNYLFANRSIKLLLIDSGYHTLQFTLYGIILGLWH